MLLEGLPAPRSCLFPVVFPISEAMGIDPIHFNIVQTAACGDRRVPLPPMGCRAIDGAAVCETECRPALPAPMWPYMAGAVRRASCSSSASRRSA